MTKWRIFWTLTLLGIYHSLSAQTQIEFNNTSGGCPRGSVSSCTAPDNRVSFFVTTQEPDPPGTNPNIIPRFKAFWITGDGNYLEFPNTATDAESLNPLSPYNYGKAGNYNIAVYLTGKYTNHNPPPGAARQISTGAPPNPLPPRSEFTPTQFNQRSGTNSEIDFFPMHEIRQNYLTPLIMSYPAATDSTWAYLFFNGHHTETPWNEKPLKYQRTELPDYYNGLANGIKDYPAADLSNGGAIDGTYFINEFANFKDKYSDVLYFPLETVNAGSLPQGFSKKRYFPVFWADSSSAISIGASDSLLSFCFVLTSNKPLPAGTRRNRLNQLLESMKTGLSATNPINISTSIDFSIQQSKIAAQQPGTIAAPQYIQGVYIQNIRYVRAHDPNQLTVKNIELLPGGDYKVTFHLEMCNKGGGRTDEQTINLFDRFGRFSNFTFDNNPVAESPAGSRHYIMTSHLGIEGIPEGHYEMQCGSIEFTAVTNCDGIRSLWNTNFERPFEVCVKFTEAFDTECGENMQIDSCDYKIDKKCPCAKTPAATCGGQDWMLIFVLLIVLLLLVWRYVSNQV